MAEDAALSALWEGAGGKYEELREDAHRRVRRWAWAPGNAEWERLLPLYNESVNGEPRPGRELAGEPSNPGNAVRYGYDADGRIVVAETFLSKHQRFTEEFLLDGPEGVLSLCYDLRSGGPMPMFATLAAPRRDRVELYLHRSRDAYERTEVVRDGERVTGFRGTATVEGETTDDVVRVEYRGSVPVAVVSETYGEIYRRPELPPRKAYAAVEDLLVEAIPPLVARSAPAGALGYVLLVIDPAVRLPPTVAVQTADDRDRAHQPGVPADEQDLWLAGDLTAFVEGVDHLAEDPAVADANGHLTGDDHEARLRKLLTRAAKRLNEAAWPGVTLDDGFFVAAVGTDQENVGRDLKDSVPRSRRGWLKANRLI